MNNFLVLILVIYAVTVTAFGTTNDDQRLVGDFDASLRQFPYQASIRNQSMEHFCSGSIISSEWILTSGTCLRRVKSINMRVVVGSVYLDSGGFVHKVLFIVEYPGSSDNSTRDDIGLIRVIGQIIFNDFVKPIALFSGDTPTNLPLNVSGWGTVGFWKIPFSVLQRVVLKIIPDIECKRIFSLFVDSHFCTGITRLTNCIQDAGSPLVHNGEQHAVASKTSHCRFFFKPDLHTRVASYRDWIEDVTNTQNILFRQGGFCDNLNSHFCIDAGKSKEN